MVSTELVTIGLPDGCPKKILALGVLAIGALRALGCNRADLTATKPMIVVSRSQRDRHYIDVND
jgi:hypothetical protein